MTLSAAEQYLLELINRARLDPQAEADRYNLDLNNGLDAGTISGDALQVLAPNSVLDAAATAHSDWMLNADTFSHTGRNGSSAGDRMTASGYEFVGGWTWRENLAWAGTTGTIDLVDAIENHHEGLYRSAGHRENTFDADISEVGLGQVEGMFSQNGQTYSSSMLTENFAASGSSAFVTGVAYRDTDGDNFYSVGEGRSDIWLEVGGAATHVSTAGGYGVDVGTANSVNVTVGTGNTAYGDLQIDMTQGNAKLDLVTATDGEKTLFLSASADLGSGLTNARLLGVADLDLNGSSARDVLVGNSGANRMNGEGSADQIRGNNGADHLSGSGGHDTIWGGKGEDRIWGGTADDVLKAGKGDDVAKGGKGNDTVYGEAGNDVLQGDAGKDKIYGADGADDLSGGSDADKIWGGDGNDAISGGTGTDKIWGSKGTDKIWGGDDADQMWGGKGADKIWGGQGADLLKGDDDNDQLKGGLGKDEIHGGSGADKLFGNEDADKLKGGSGDDRLDGGKGNDQLTGGLGADTFIFNNGADRIVDFTDNEDAIAISAGIVGGADVTTAEVLAMGAIVGGNAVFDFGDGHTLKIDDVTNLSVLENDLFVV